MPTAIQNTFDILPFPMNAYELILKLEKICEAYPLAYGYQVKYDREFDRIYLARPEVR